MKHVIFEVLSIECVRKNDLIGKDEIYLVMIPSAFKDHEGYRVDGDKSATQGFYLSDIAQKIKKSEVRNLPFGQKTFKSIFAFDESIATQVQITLGLIDLDKGGNSRQVLEKAKQISEDPSFPWIDVFKELPTSFEPLEILAAAFKIAGISAAHLLRDDLVDIEQIEIPLSLIDFPYENNGTLEFYKAGTIYNMSYKVRLS